MRTRAAEVLERALAKHASFVERVTVRFSDVNGPRGGIDTLCSLKAVLRSLPSVVTEERSSDQGTAFASAAKKLAIAVQRAIERSGRRAPRKKRALSPERSTPAGPVPSDGLIGRREGRSRANLEQALDRPEKRRRDDPVDTSLPGVSATDRRAGGESTARRNTKRNMAGMTAALEDSTKDRPSRKSTRRSANRAKQATELTRRQMRRTRSPKIRAVRDRVKAS